MDWYKRSHTCLKGTSCKQCIKMSQYFNKPFRRFEGNINVKVDLSNYTIKTGWKKVTHVDTSSFVLKTNLPNLKAEADKLDIDKLVLVSVNLRKLSDVVKTDVVKKSVFDKLVAKVKANPLNNIDTSDFVLKTKYNTDKTELEKKIPYTSGLVKKIDYNTKVTEIEGKIPDISNLATKTAWTAVENKIPSVSNLVKKQPITLKLQKLKINLIIIVMTNILQL